MNILEKLRKVAELASRGIGGEKENAQKLLNELLEKYNVSLDELHSDTKHRCRFKYHGKVEKNLLIQIIKLVCNRVAIYHTKGDGNEIWAEMTESQRVEVLVSFETHSEAVKKEMELFFSAYIHRNNLALDPDPNAPPPKSHMSLDELERMIKMMASIEPTAVNKRIT